MLVANARVRLLGGLRTWDLAPGAIVGRSPAAAMRIHDPEVSEAHAMVSLRGRGLHLLRLRGPLVIDGVDEDELELRAGQVVSLNPRCALEVLDVSLPQRVLAIEGLDGGLWELAARAYSVLVGDDLDIVPGIHADARAFVWNDGEGWHLQQPDGSRGALTSGQGWEIAGRLLRIVELPVTQAAARSTVGGRREHLTLVARYASCHIQRARRQTVVIDGQPGRVLSELVTMGVPVTWTSLVAELWPGVDPAVERDRLRRRWDRVLRRTRLKLREAGLREDLVRADGAGNVELVLLPGDRVVDQS